MIRHERIDRCLVCNGRKLTPYLNLGNQPLANSYHKGSHSQNTYPLGVQFCETCAHSQLTYKVDNHLMFDDYPYVSGTSQTLDRYFRGFCQYVMSNWKGKKPPRVLEIASNDATLLEMFKQRGCKAVGVEPAQNLLEYYKDLSIPVYNCYWNNETADTILEDEGKFDVVIAVNVLPHVPNPQAFLEACRLMVDPNGVKQGGGVYIQTSQCDMFKNGEWDAIYHEHHSYFTASSFGTLAYGAGMEIMEASKVPIHSMSFLFKLRPMSGEGHCDSLYAMLEEEVEGGWGKVETYKEWAKKVDNDKKDLLANLQMYKTKGWSIVVYGASAKFSTVSNYLELNADYAVDDNHLKWGLYTPGRDIKIRSPEWLVGEGPLLIIMGAWNFSKEIEQRIKALRPEDLKDYGRPTMLLSYIPKVELKELWT